MFMSLWQVWLVAQLQGSGEALGQGTDVVRVMDIGRIRGARGGWQIQQYPSL